MASTQAPYGILCGRMFRTEDQWIEFMKSDEYKKFHGKFIIDELKKEFGTEHIAFVSNEESDDLTQLLWIAEKGNRDAFIDGLSWVAWSTNGKPKSTMFIFPKGLSRFHRRNIHMLSLKGQIKSVTVCDKLHVFVKELK